MTAISFGVGFANLTSFINEALGWRESILAVSAFGFLVTLLIISLKEPLRQAERGTQEHFEIEVEKRTGTTMGIHLSKASRNESFKTTSEFNITRNKSKT